MPQEYDATGAEMPSDGFTIPDNEYDLEIVKAKDGKSKNGDYQVTCDLKVIGGAHDGFDVKFHRVTFFDPKGDKKKAAGMSVFFLKVIGQPWEGKFQINPENWKGKRFHAYLAEKEYNGFKSMEVKWFAPLENGSQVPASELVEEVPF